MTANPLEIINSADAALAQASHIIDILELRTQAKALETVAIAEGLGEIAQKAKIFQLRAERKAGGWLADNIRPGRPKSCQPDRVSLEQLEINPSQSSRWQLVARLPDDCFNAWVDSRIERGHEITAGGLRQYARNYINKNGSTTTTPQSTQPIIYIGSSMSIFLRPTQGRCALQGYEIECDYTQRLQGHHLINKSAARGNAALREILVSCPDELMAQVCVAHNVGRMADSETARRVLLLQKVFEYGLVHMRDFINGLPWKVQPYEYTLEGILQ